MKHTFSIWRTNYVLIPIFIGSVLAGRLTAAEPNADQTPQHFEKQILITVKLDYLLYLPPAYSATEKRWPLVIFLHGAGESGSELAKVKTHGPPKLIAEGKQFPFIVVSPQCPGRGWNVDALNALLDDVMSRYKVDPNRVYLTGLSMGGYGSWAWAAEHPERFAAVVPICGGGNPSTANRLKNLPIWVFHGAKDPTVPLKQSQDMVDALKAAGGNVKFTIYPEAGHDSWTETYNNPQLYDWLLRQTRETSVP